jgi:hypothetical protein
VQFTRSWDPSNLYPGPRLFKEADPIPPCFLSHIHLQIVFAVIHTVESIVSFGHEGGFDHMSIACFSTTGSYFCNSSLNTQGRLRLPILSHIGQYIQACSEAI